MANFVQHFVDEQDVLCGALSALNLDDVYERGAAAILSAQLSSVEAMLKTSHSVFSGCVEEFYIEEV